MGLCMPAQMQVKHNSSAKFKGLVSRHWFDYIHIICFVGLTSFVAGMWCKRNNVARFDQRSAKPVFAPPFRCSHVISTLP